MMNSNQDIAKRCTRNYALDLCKIFAALFITFNHCGDLLLDFPPLEQIPLGYQGNALYFFISGFLLLAAYNRKPKKFVSWYSNRLLRLWPAIAIWVLFTGVVFGDSITFKRLFTAHGYWFVQWIAVWYIPYYFIMRHVNNGIGYALLLFISFIIVIAWGGQIPESQNVHKWIYQTDIWYFFYFQYMVFGGFLYKFRKRIMPSAYMDWIFFGISILVFFVIKQYCLGYSHGVKFYGQFLAMLPLYATCYYAYKIGLQLWVENAFTSRLGKYSLAIVASTTLEIYIVQFHLFTDKLNFLFPLNFIIIFAEIIFVAWLLHYVTDYLYRFVAQMIVKGYAYVMTKN